MRSQTKELEGYFASEGANVLQVKEVLSNCFKYGKVGHLVQIWEQINEKKKEKCAGNRREQPRFRKIQ